MMLVAFMLLTFGISSYALWRGGAPERWVAVLFLLGMILSMAISIAMPPTPRGFQAGIFCVDALMLCAMVAVMLRARRYWPIAVAAMQLLSVMGHVIKLVDPQVMTVVYWITSAFWALPQLAILAIGTTRHRSRLRRSGSDPDWTTGWRTTRR